MFVYLITNYDSGFMDVVYKIMNVGLVNFSIQHFGYNRLLPYDNIVLAFLFKCPNMLCLLSFLTILFGLNDP